MKKLKPKLKTYSIIADNIVTGIRWGIARAHKHVDNPSREHLENTVYEAVMATLDEIIDFGDE